MNLPFAVNRRQVAVIAVVLVAVVLVVGIGLGGSNKKSVVSKDGTVVTTDTTFTFGSTKRGVSTTTTTAPPTAPSAGTAVSVPPKGLKSGIAAKNPVASSSRRQAKVPVSHAPKPPTSRPAKVPTSTTLHKHK